MTTITATAAATQAGVTVATIRTWCRRGVVAAAKAAGRWVIDTASLAHRIAIGARRTRKQAPMRLNLGHSWKHRSRFTVVGPAAQLQQAFESGTPVTLTGDCDGDRVYLGISRQTHGDMGLTMETLALDAHLGEGLASYLIDTQRLADAPQLGAIVAREQARADRIDAEVAAQDDRYLNPDYE